MDDHTITLTAGDSHVEIDPVGSALVGLKLGDRVLIPKADSTKKTFFGSLLAPWPNRTRGAQYQFGGKEYFLVANDGLGNANHGLVHDQRALVAQSSPSSAVLTLSISPSDSYPFRLELSVKFELTQSELKVEIAATNVGNETAPVGIGHHPYFAVAEDTTVEIFANSAAEHDEKKIPKKLISAQSLGLGSGSARLISELNLDTQFSGLGETAAELCFGSECYQMWLTGGDYLMVYNPVDFPWASGSGPAIAIEPQSCAVDALNTGDGLNQLAPGSTMKLIWGIRKVR